MDEEKNKPEEKKPVEPVKELTDGVQSETENQFDKAAQVVKELKTENDRTEKLVERNEKLAVQRELSGKGTVPPPQAPQISKEEQAANERIKAVGNATGANWAKNMDEKDGTKI